MPILSEDQFHTGINAVFRFFIKHFVAQPVKIRKGLFLDSVNLNDPPKMVHRSTKPGSPGFEGKDHYHQRNPNSTGKGDYYLDIDGNPVPKGSKRSHILPQGD